MTAEFAPGIVIPLKPFFGSMGVAPAPELGRVSSNPPGTHAGNLDNKELVAGIDAVTFRCSCRARCSRSATATRAQGDGEVDQTAIETSLRGRLQLTVRKDMKLTWPRAETATDYISMAADPDLTVATKIAIQEMVDFLAATKKLTKHQAYQLVEHRRQRRDHAARGQAQPRRPREDAEEHLQIAEPAIASSRLGRPRSDS